MSSLQIGKSIYTVLSEVLPKKCFPLVADQGTTYPFIVYRRVALNPATTKDRFNYSELATVEVMIADNNYSGSINLAEQVKEKLEHTRGNISDINIGKIKLFTAEESFLEDAYIQKMTFEIQIQH